MYDPNEIPAGAYPETEEEAYWTRMMEERDEQEAAAYVTHYGLQSYVNRLLFEQEEERLAEACAVLSFYDDPITRSASFDGFEMAGLTRPIRERDAAAGCKLCQRELAEV